MNVFLDNEQFEFLLKAAVDQTGTQLTLRSEGDGTLRIYGLQVGVDTNGEEIVFLTEDDGTKRSQLMLWDYTGGAQIRAAGEPTTGEARTLPHGKDEANNIDSFRTDPNRIIWSRPHEEYISVPSAEIPVAEGDLWAPGLADTIRYLVEFNVINNDVGGAAIAGVYVGRDIDAGGALAAPEYWLYDETIPSPGQTGWQGPYYMHGDDAVRGVAGVANDASIHFRVRRIDTGA